MARETEVWEWNTPAVLFLTEMFCMLHQTEMAASDPSRLLYCPSKSMWLAYGQKYSI